MMFLCLSVFSRWTSAYSLSSSSSFWTNVRHLHLVPRYLNTVHLVKRLEPAGKNRACRQAWTKQAPGFGSNTCLCKALRHET